MARSETPETTAQDPTKPTRAAPSVLFLWTAVVAVVGGYAGGWALHWFGALGGVSIVLLGLIAGVISRRMLGYDSRLAGALLAIACLAAATLGQISFIHWNDVEGRRSWGKAIELLPTVIREDAPAAAVLVVCAAIGALTAFAATVRKQRRDYSVPGQ